ncbi:hypothetical protein ATCC90586_007345 [Pythium insidiosum]|nr:hypothetical protein ATCC90586_007345 [Pythium insidiosum]
MKLHAAVSLLLVSTHAVSFNEDPLDMQPIIRLYDSLETRGSGESGGQDKKNSVRTTFSDDQEPDWGEVVGPWAQCGGKGYKGLTTCLKDWSCVCGGRGFNYRQYGVVTTGSTTTLRLQCEPGFSCEVVNEFYFQCIRGGPAVALWGQCGGVGYDGPTDCVIGTRCHYYTAWYSQCLPA